MNYTEATRRSRQMPGGMTKTALEGWQRAGLGATGGGLLAYTMASLINPSMSRRGKILSTLAGMGTGAAAGYRFLPGYESGKATAGPGNGGNAGNATTDTSTTTTQAQAKAPAQTAAKTPATTQTKAPAPAPAKAPVKTPAQTVTQTPAQEIAPAENLGSLGGTPAVEPAPAATPAPAPASAPTAAPATAPEAAPAAADQEDDDVSGAVYRTLGGLGLGLGGAGLYAGNKALKNRRVRQFGARRQQVREDQDTYAAWNAALEELAHRPQMETPSAPAQSASQAPAQTAAGAGKATTMSVEDLRREQDMEYRRRMRLDPDVLPDITHFDPAGYRLDKMGPRNAEKFLREISLGFNPSIPREVQLLALKNAYRRNAYSDDRYWPSLIAERLKERAINALKKDNPNFIADLETAVGERGSKYALHSIEYIPIRLQNGKYSLRKISPYETFDPLTASRLDETDRIAARRGTPDVWDAKQYGVRLVPNSEGKVNGWVPEMAPSAESKPVRAARLARAVSAGSKVLSILLRALDN